MKELFQNDTTEAMIVRVAMRFNKFKHEVLELDMEDLAWHYAAFEMEQDQLKESMPKSP